VVLRHVQAFFLRRPWSSNCCRPVCLHHHPLGVRISDGLEACARRHAVQPPPCAHVQLLLLLLPLLLEAALRLHNGQQHVGPQVDIVVLRGEKREPDDLGVALTHSAAVVICGCHGPPRYRIINATVPVGALPGPPPLTTFNRCVKLQVLQGGGVRVAQSVCKQGPGKPAQLSAAVRKGGWAEHGHAHTLQASSAGRGVFWQAGSHTGPACSSVEGSSLPISHLACSGPGCTLAGNLLLLHVRTRRTHP